MANSVQHEDYVVTDRNGIIENRHRVHAAVTDATGKALFTLGDPSRLTLARSTAKPFQTLALLETHGFDKYAFDDVDVALMCASHNSEERHVARSRAMLARLKAEEKDLRCGGHPSINEAVNRDWIRRDFIPGALCNNCSGKHVAMLAAAHLFGDADPANYHLPDHPIQLKVKRVFEELSGLQAGEMKWGIDGCNLPAPALPLCNLSHMYALLAQAADKASIEDSSKSTRTQHLGYIFNSMSKHPEMVGGEDRFCTALALAFPGGLLGKLGADACYGVAIRESDETRRVGANGAMGIAVKIEDGSIEVLYAVVAEILEQLDIGAPETRRKLARFHYLRRVNTAGVAIGNVSFPFKIRTT